VSDIDIIIPESETVLIEAREEVSVISPQQETIVVEVKTESVVIYPQPEVILVEIVQGLPGPPGPPGVEGPRGQSDFPDGTNTGDIIRYNAVSGDWESCAEPFEFRGIVLVPMALSGGVVAEGYVGYNAVDKRIYVQID
jgi:hypothetical protein